MDFKSLLKKNICEVKKIILQESERNNFNFFDKLDDYYVQVLLQHNPRLTKTCCELVRDCLKKRKWRIEEARKQILLYNNATLFSSLLVLNQYSEAKNIFLDTLKQLDEKKHSEIAQTITFRIYKGLSDGYLPNDIALHLLHESSKFFKNIQDWEAYIDVGKNACYLFSSSRLFQAAYRLLNDMQEICIREKRLDLQVIVLETQSSVSFDERDFTYAADHFKKTINLIKSLGNEIPIRLLGNLAISLNNSGDTLSARKEFEKIYGKNNLITLHSKDSKKLAINYLINLKETNDSKMEKVFYQLVDLYENEPEIIGENSHIIYLTLIKVALIIGQTEKAEIYLSKYMKEIDVELNRNFRLHSRRGIKENHLQGLKNILEKHEGLSLNSFLKILSLLTSNSHSDWIALIRWFFEKIENEKSSDLQFAGYKKLENLINHGSPVYHGFKEKYDDPFDINYELLMEQGFPENIARSLDLNIPWSDFFEEISRLSQNDSWQDCYKESSLHNKNLLLLEKSKNSIVIYTMLAKDSVKIFFCFKNNLSVVNVKIDQYSEYCDVLSKYSMGQSKYLEFVSQLTSFVRDNSSRVQLEITNLLKTVNESSNEVELLHICDYETTNFPLMAILMDCENLRNRFKIGTLDCFRVPILAKSFESPKSDIESIIYALNYKDDLGLTKEESFQISREITSASISEIDLSSKELKDINLGEGYFGVHISSHCIPQNIYRDPHYIKTGLNNEQGLYLGEVQKFVYRSKLRLAFINTCCSGTFLNRNYHKEHFYTNESFGFVTSFMSNGIAEVISTIWKIPEILGLVVSVLFYRNLESGFKISKALNVAMATLYNVTKSDLIAIIDRFDDIEIKNKYKQQFSKSIDQYPFRNHFFFGCYYVSKML